MWRTTVPAFSTESASPITGSTITPASSTQRLILTPAGLLAALTIVFPTWFNGQEFVITSTQVITTLTLTGTISWAITTLWALGYVQYNFFNGTWYRIW